MDPAKLKVVELRAQLSQRGLDAKGNKAVLVERLRKALEEETASRDQESIIQNAENICDAASKESNEKGTEAAKSSQPSKPSGRSSRSLTATTPVKNKNFRRTTQRSSVTPDSVKQTSPSKADHAEESCEALPVISESVEQEKAETSDRRSASPIENEEREEAKDLSIALQSKTCVLSLTKVDEEFKNSSIAVACTKTDKSSGSISEESTVESPRKVGEAQSRPLEKLETTDECSERTKEIVESTTEGASPAENESMDKEDNGGIDEQDQILDQTHKEATIEEDVRTEEHQDTEVKSNDCHTEDKTDVQVSVDDSSENIVESLPKEEEKMEDTSLENKDKTTVDKATEEDKEGTPTAQMETIDEADDKSDAKKEEQEDVEMAEIKHGKEESKDPQDANDTKDRKRKRSPSPGEDQDACFAPQLSENEPDIDDSALILSWYDSDLNLVIDSDGFFTATPMHNDGFSHMWAGVRASYGFLHGKVYYEAKITEHCAVDIQDEEHPHVLRIGWSASYTSMQLGEEKLSYGYDSTGKKSTDNEFVDYGLQFGKDDIIGCYLDATSEDNVVLSYTMNGKDLGTAFNISKQELHDKPLFPHILSKNCSFACNFGQEKPWAEQILDDFVSIGSVESQYKVPGPRRPEKREECEVIMLCGLPASGKTVWATKHVANYPDKMYNILGIGSLIDKMKNMGLPCKQRYAGQWEVLIEKCTRVLNKLLEMAPTRRRNYILDQTNVYPSAQRRKMKNFCGYQRKAVVIVPTEEEFKLRTTKHEPIEGKVVPDTVLMEMKANFSVPVVGESFDSVDWVELDKDEGKKLIDKYNKEGKEAGFGQQPANKRPRIDKPDSNREIRDVRNSRDGRDNRDHRDRRSNYTERNRNPVWRGGSNMAWRDRPQRGGHIRHGGGYGPPIPWRGRGAPVPPAYRGLDRRGGSGDRRAGNDRNRSAGSRQGAWGPMSNYQGSQQPVWGQQGGGWPGGQSQGSWDQQGGWGPQWNNWKSYGQGSYNQTNYNQQGYGNGNWSSWNEQYYSQYWSQPQQTGQTTTAGGQAVSKQ